MKNRIFQLANQILANKVKPIDDREVGCASVRKPSLRFDTCIQKPPLSKLLILLSKGMRPASPTVCSAERFRVCPVKFA